jgi:hypothetical protein
VTRSFGKVNCELTVPLGGRGGEQPVDRQVLGEWLRKIARTQVGHQRGPGASGFGQIAEAVESATGTSLTLNVAMTAEDADSVRLGVLGLLDRARNPPRGLAADELGSHRAAAYGLVKFAGAWARCTGWDVTRQAGDGSGLPALGSGYAR